MLLRSHSSKTDSLDSIKQLLTQLAALLGTRMKTDFRNALIVNASIALQRLGEMLEDLKNENSELEQMKEVKQAQQNLFSASLPFPGIDIDNSAASEVASELREFIIDDNEDEEAEREGVVGRSQSIGRNCLSCACMHAS